MSDLRQENEPCVKAETENRPESITDSEFHPDGEERFRAAVRAAAKSGPMHRPAKR